MEKLFCFATLLLMFFFGPADQVWAQMNHHNDLDLTIPNDRLMTNQVSSIQLSIAKIEADALKGHLEAVKPGIRTIRKNWVGVKSELQVRNDRRSINQFEEDLKSLDDSLEAKNKTAIIQQTQGLSTAFNNVVDSLEKADVDVSKLLGSLGWFMLAWAFLTLVAAFMMRGGKIRL